ncbi:hypothetical protein GC194_14665 [bacterium]|nr:hypothetical protein [bacterium]
MANPVDFAAYGFIEETLNEFILHLYVALPQNCTFNLTNPNWNDDHHADPLYFVRDIVFDASRPYATPINYSLVDAGSFVLDKVNKGINELELEVTINYELTGTGGKKGKSITKLIYPDADLRGGPFVGADSETAS